MPFSASAVFCFTSSTSAKCFPLRTFFHGRNKKNCSGKQKKSLGVRGWGMGVMLFFGQKLLNIQHGVGRCTHKSPIMKWAKHWESSKNSLKLNAASHNNTSWYTDTDGFLEHSPSGWSLYNKGPSLQKIIPVFWVSPCIDIDIWSHKRLHTVEPWAVLC